MKNTLNLSTWFLRPGVGLLVLSILFTLAGGCEVAGTDTDSGTGSTESFNSSAPLVDPAENPVWDFPQKREIEGGELIMHAPQVREWQAFESIVTQIAFEYQPTGDDSVKLGTALFTGATETDLSNRLVTISSIAVTDVSFADEVPETYSSAIKNMALRDTLEVPIDLFLTYLAADALEFTSPEGFNTDPPAIHFAQSPTILLFLNGEAVLAPVGQSDISVVANANWPTFRLKNDAYYLLNRTTWMTAAELKGPWEITQSLPAAFSLISEEELQPAILVAIPPVASNSAPPDVLFTTESTELIVTDGKPVLVEIAGTNGLSYVDNTDSQLFKVEDSWYILAAGRWFSAEQLDSDDWKFVERLPESFSGIPKDHEKSAVLASVRGTQEAQLAALESIVPVKKEAGIDTEAPDVSYAGEPSFVPINTTGISRAANTSYDILEYKGTYYLCYSGMWYSAQSPVGSWRITSNIPPVLYDIPPSSPSYHVTHVKVYSSSPSKVVYTYPPAYSTSVYVYYGVPVYGTGWYYPPYVYGSYYYPYYASYGHGTWYNSNTGTYGSRSVAYGPYGGYSYSQGYNPRSGRYGYAETAWDHDEWAGYSETYNPRSGVGTESYRYFDEDRNKMRTQREVSKGNRSVSLDRTVDYDTGIANVERETASGASSNTRRELDNGTLRSQGTVTAADGRTATISGTQTREGGTTTIRGSDGASGVVTRDTNANGATREGAFSKNGQTANTQTQRRGATTSTTLETSQGGQAVSASRGIGRSTVGQSASGDLYAGHDGSVYKKSDSGWSKYDQGNWKQVNTSERAGDRAADRGVSAQPRDFSKELEAARDRGAQSNRSTSRSGVKRSQSNRSMTNRGSLDRDFNARRNGYDRFSQRRNGFQGRGGARGGGRRR